MTAEQIIAQNDVIGRHIDWTKHQGYDRNGTATILRMGGERLAYAINFSFLGVKQAKSQVLVASSTGVEFIHDESADIDSWEEKPLMEARVEMWREDPEPNHVYYKFVEDEEAEKYVFKLDLNEMQVYSNQSLPESWEKVETQKIKLAGGREITRVIPQFS